MNPLVNMVFGLLFAWKFQFQIDYNKDVVNRINALQEFDLYAYKFYEFFTFGFYNHIFDISVAYCQLLVVNFGFWAIALYMSLVIYVVFDKVFFEQHGHKFYYIWVKIMSLLLPFLIQTPISFVEHGPLYFAIAVLVVVGKYLPLIFRFITSFVLDPLSSLFLVGQVIAQTKASYLLVPISAGIIVLFLYIDTLNFGQPSFRLSMMYAGFALFPIIFTLYAGKTNLLALIVMAVLLVVILSSMVGFSPIIRVAIDYLIYLPMISLMLSIKILNLRQKGL